jgi:hypothetical protein
MFLSMIKGENFHVFKNQKPKWFALLCMVVLSRWNHCLWRQWRAYLFEINKHQFFNLIAYLEICWYHGISSIDDWFFYSGKLRVFAIANPLFRSKIRSLGDGCASWSSDWRDPLLGQSNLFSIYLKAQLFVSRFITSYKVSGMIINASNCGIFQERSAASSSWPMSFMVLS